VRRARDDAGAQAERPAQAAGHVVLPAALPGPEGAGGADAPLPGVQAQHHLTQGHRVEAARRCGSDEQVSHRGTPLVWSVLWSVRWWSRGSGQRWAAATASAVSCWIPAKSPALTRSRGTIQEPPPAAPAGMARYSARFAGPTPPVGTNWTSPNGAASALIAAGPPAGTARENLTGRRPTSSPAGAPGG